MQKYPVLLKVATLTTEELLSLSHSFGDPLRSDVKRLVPKETYYLVLSSSSLTFYARETVPGMTLNSLQPLDVKYGGSVFCS